jgi:hypothetical protein
MATQEAPDHDQRFKSLIVQFFREFFSYSSQPWRRADDADHDASVGLEPRPEQ